MGKIKFTFKLDRFRVIEFSIKEIEGNLTKRTPISYSISHTNVVNLKLNQVDIKLKIELYVKPENILASSITTITSYKIKNLSDFVRIENQPETKIEIPKEIIITLVSIAYSTTRGAMSVMGRGTLLDKFVCPLIDPKYLVPEKQGKAVK